MKKISLIFILVILIGGVFLFSGAKTAKAMAPVTICENDPTRFCSGGEPYFLSANFLTLEEPYTKERDCTYLAPCMNTTRRSNVLNILTTSNQYNAQFIWLTIEGERSDQNVTPYKNSFFGGDFDDAKIQNWRTKIIELINNGIRPVLWLFPDDAPSIHGTRRDSGASIEEKKTYIEKMVDSFDDLPVMWVLGLEVNEYWNKPYCDTLGNYLQSIANNPVGLHQTGGRVDYMTSDWVDFGMYQYGIEHNWFSSSPYRDTLSWGEIYNETIQKKAELGNKPFVAAEYDVEGSTAAKQRGLAAAFAGAAGTGNGAPSGLDEFMQGLPNGLTSTKSGNMLSLQGSGGLAQVNMTNLTSYAITDPFDTNGEPPDDGTPPDDDTPPNNGSSDNESDTDPQPMPTGGFVPCGDCLEYDKNNGKCLRYEPPCTFCHIFVVFDNIIDFLLVPCLSGSNTCVSNGGFPIVLTIALIMLVIGGVMYFFSAGNPGTLATAKKLLTSVIIGLVIVYGAWLIVSLFFTTIGVNSWTGLNEWWKIDCQ